MDITNHKLDNERYSYLAPAESQKAVEPLLNAIIDSSAFKRLKDIRFLGSIDYWLIPSPNGSKKNARYTRYQHSLGVARLALMYADIRELPLKERYLILAAALLHDIGHAPFSHSVEPFFQQEFGINHHIATSRIILGDSIFGSEILNILNNYSVNPDEVICLLDGKDERFEGFFSGPINFDTIEGILRSRCYIAPTYVSPHPIDVMRAAINRSSKIDQQLVDSFWTYKHEIYQFLIRSPTGVLADYLSQEVYKKNKSRISHKDYFNTERNMVRRIPDLRKALFAPKSAVRLLINEAEPIPYQVRNFIIRPDSNFFDRDDGSRYTQSKDVKILQRHFILAEVANRGTVKDAGSLYARQNIFRY